MERTEAVAGKAVEAHERFDWSLTRPSDAVVEVVADLASGSPTSFGPLYDRIDPDALDAIFRTDTSGRSADETSVSFPLAERFVSVHATGEVVVRAPTRDGAEE